MAVRDYPPVNINEATVEELMQIEKVGLFLAQRIVAARPYETVDDLSRVSGIGAKMLDYLRLRVTTTKPALPTTVETAAVVVAASETAEDKGLPDMPVNENKTLPQNDPNPFPDSAPDLQEEVTAGEDPFAEKKTALETSHAEEPLAGIAPLVVAPPPGTADTLETAHPVQADLPAEAPGMEEEEMDSVIYTPDIEEQPVRESWIPENGKEPAVPQIEKQAPRTQSQTAVKPGVRRGEMLGWLVGGSLFTLLVAVLFSLGVLSILNGSLRYRTESRAQNEMLVLQDRIESMDTRVADISTDITGLRTRLDALETLSGRVSTLETDAAALEVALSETNESLNALVQEISELDAEMDVLNQEVAEIRESTGIFETFLQQLKGLLVDLVPESAEGIQE